MLAGVVGIGAKARQTRIAQLQRRRVAKKALFMLLLKKKR